MELILALIWFIAMQRFYAYARRRSATIDSVYVVDLVEAEAVTSRQLATAGRRGWS